ncbi:CPBP family intramembrane glutamic endopeptidase [Verrucomicrobium sp. 3C]|uniref:CPBP family intramembrane glutamic endopeptidase n=1 Tax=Verrucomicrobium sp. 3C TaxID=1134055 RepID=UPI000380BE23|nr:CPBP family intramembrane glutamic endopeptidase [Verrucomicrobium sp. 3C]
MPSTERSPSPLLAFLAYLLSIFLAATLLSPAIHALLHRLYPAPPERYFRRVLEISALLLLLTFRKKMGIRSWPDIGFSRPVLRPLLLGCLLGLVSGLLCLLPLALSARPGHQVGIHLEPASFALWIGRGMLIALSEELLFRGIFFTTLRRGLGPFLGLLASALLFCLAHYLRAGPTAAEGPLTLFTGWNLLSAHLAPILSFAWLDPRGLLLFSAGAALAAAYQVTGSLWLPIGIHALWVAILYGLEAQSGGSPLGWWSPLVIAFLGILLWTGFGWQRRGRAA